VVRLLVQEGELTADRTGDRDSWTVRIPEGVREVIGRRLNRLSQRCNDTLTIASVIGREFTLDQMKPLVDDMTEDRLLEVLEEALSTRVIEELPQMVGRYQFTHALIQETLTQELTLTRRVRLHARIAETLETLYAGNEEAHAAELAHLFAEAEAVLGTEKLARYSLLAGDRALAAYAWEEALAHFQRGMGAKEGQPIDTETAALLFGLGRAQAATLQRHQAGIAVDTLRRAFDYFADIEDIPRALAVAEYPFQSNAALLAGAGQLIPRALSLVPPDSLQAGYLLSRHGFVLGRAQGDYAGAEAAFDQALKVAREKNDALLEMRTLVNAADVDWWYCRNEESLNKTLRAIDLAQHVDDPRTEAVARIYASRNLLSLGVPDEAYLHGVAGLEMAERLGDSDLLGESSRNIGNLATLKGEFQVAREIFDRMEETNPRQTGLIIDRIVLQYDAGDFDQGAASVERLLDLVRHYPPGPSVASTAPAFVLPLVARVTGAPDRFDVAKAAAETTLSSPNATPVVIRFANMGLGLMAFLQGDVEEARERYTAAESGSGTHMAPAFMAGDHLLGLLARTMGDLDLAMTHLEDALAFCRKAGYRPELAWTCCDYADALRERDGEGDRAKAISLLDESLAISSELGMRPLMERVLSRREILKA